VPVVVDAVEDLPLPLDLGEGHRLSDTGLVGVAVRLHPHGERVARAVANRRVGAAADDSRASGRRRGSTGVRSCRPVVKNGRPEPKTTGTWLTTTWFDQPELEPECSVDGSSAEAAARAAREGPLRPLGVLAVGTEGLT
jgi:hypothetical protein